MLTSKASAGAADLQPMIDLLLADGRLGGCAHLKARGATRARLGTSSSNTAMRAAAESAGDRVESAMLWFGKDVR